jgi:predicted DNA-binding transcriptional regulator YafY
MWDTPARLLRLLSLLQVQRDWTGRELAARLEVDVRTVRRDMERLRGLGYPVHSTPGVAGGYRLEAGTDLPPLLLDDQEAIAVAVCLRTAAGGTVAGIEEAASRALAKLDRLLPNRLRGRAGALSSATVAMTSQRPVIDPDDLAAIAAACRDHQVLRFDYRTNRDVTARRTVEPLRLVHTGRLWYLVGWDRDRADWRTFRVDRVGGRPVPVDRFEPRPFPFDDVAAFVSRGTAVEAYPVRATVIVHETLEVAAVHVSPNAGVLEARDTTSCTLHLGARTVADLAHYLQEMDLQMTVVAPEELRDHLSAMAVRLARVVGPLDETRSGLSGASG